SRTTRARPAGGASARWRRRASPTRRRRVRARTSRRRPAGRPPRRNGRRHRPGGPGRGPRTPEKSCSCHPTLVVVCHPCQVTNDTLATPTCILGLGLIGGSLMRDLAEADAPVYGWNRSAGTAEAAAEEGFDAS